MYPDCKTTLNLYFEALKGFYSKMHQFLNLIFAENGLLLSLNTIKLIPWGPQPQKSAFSM